MAEIGKEWVGFLGPRDYNAKEGSLSFTSEVVLFERGGQKCPL